MELEAVISADLARANDEVEKTAKALKAISHPLRLKILRLLNEQEASVQEIVDAIGTTQSNISQHLGILRQQEILSTRKDATRVYYRISNEHTKKFIQIMDDFFDMR